MKTTTLILDLAALLGVVFTAELHAQGTAFSYQGRLQDNGSPANGAYDLTFELYTASSGGSQVGSTVTDTGQSVTNGLFTVTLDFGAGVFDGSDRWLEIGVRTNGASSFVTLSPRQKVTPTPYAIVAANVVSGGILTGTYGNAVTFNNAGNSFSGSFTGNGAGLTNISATTLGGLNVSNFWRTGGNSGTSPANGDFLGTTDFQPLDLKAGGMRVLRLEPDARTNVGGLSGNLIGGFINNAIEQPGSGGDFIGGGGYPAGPNVIHSNSAGVFMGAGSANQIGPNVNDAVIGGGYGNTIQSYDGVIAGGQDNTIFSNATFATIPGGYANAAAGLYSFAAGRQAKANHAGAFVWSDASGSDFSSTAPNQFSVRATGGVRFVTGGAGMTVDGVAVPVPQATVADTNHSDIVNVIEGSSANSVASGVYGATISGGGAANYNAYYVPNVVAADFGSIGGGEHNTSSGIGSTVAGGVANTASGIGSTIGGGSFESSSGSYAVVGGGFRNNSVADYATVGGGGFNSIGTNANSGTVSGGFGNQIADNTHDSAIGGGSFGSIGSNSFASTIAGGSHNSIGNNASVAAIGGGTNNTASANSATVSGGADNTASGYASTIGGGFDNNTGNNTFDSSIAGGSNNSIGNNAGATTIGGGSGNSINSPYATIGGGGINAVGTNSNSGIIGGGYDNNIGNNTFDSTIAGGSYNSIGNNAGATAIGGGSGNINGSPYATIGGGGINAVGTNSNSGTVSGGFGNQIADNTHDSTIGGGSYGSIGTNSFASTIAGGSHNSIGNNASVAAIGGGTNNTASANSATVSGGAGNTASGYASTVGGGLANTNSGAYDTIGGGYDNTASSPDGSATVGGGYFNTASGDSSAVNGGFDNIASGGYATVLGGSVSTASGQWATVGGGEGNTAAGNYSFAAGHHAQAMHPGSFVWADDSGSVFSSTASNQFLIRASGGVGVNTASPGAALEVRTSNRNGDEIRFGYNGGGAGNLIAGSTYVGIATDDLVTRLAIVQSTGNVGIGTASPDALLSVNGTADKPGGGSWNTFSDRRLKDVGGSFTNGLAALEHIQPVHYHYKADNPLKLPSQAEYIGVVAQQVQKAVPEAVHRSQSGYLVVNNDPIIWTMLNAIKELKAENDALQQRVKRLEREAALRSNQKPN